MIKHINVFGKGRVYEFCKNSLETHFLISLLTLRSTDVMVLFLETLCGTLYFSAYAHYPLADNGNKSIIEIKLQSKHLLHSSKKKLLREYKKKKSQVNKSRILIAITIQIT